MSVCFCVCAVLTGPTLLHLLSGSSCPCPLCCMLPVPLTHHVCLLPSLMPPIPLLNYAHALSTLCQTNTFDKHPAPSTLYLSLSRPTPLLTSTPWLFPLSPSPPPTPQTDISESELEMATVRHQPEGLDQLQTQTKFTRKELQSLYRGFKNVRLATEWRTCPKMEDVHLKAVGLICPVTQTALLYTPLRCSHPG